MNKNWFISKVQFEKTMENGSQKRVTESYLLDALSFTEAEARTIVEISDFVSGEFTISDIKREKLSEIFFNENGERYYKCKIYFITLDEKSGSEKKTAAYILVQANSVKEAEEVLAKGMDGTVADYIVGSIAETDIIDVYIYDEDMEAGEVVAAEK